MNKNNEARSSQNQTQSCQIKVILSCKYHKGSKMSAFKIVQQNIQVSKKEISKKLGYASAKKGLAAIDNFLKYDLNSGFYDFKYTSKHFFIELCKILEIQDIKVKVEFHNLERYVKELDRFKGSNIFIDTGFKRESQPIFILAICEGQRILKPPIKELLYKTDEEIIMIISKFVKKHFNRVNEKIGIWGNAKHYVFEFNDEKYIFDRYGELEKDIIINQKQL